MLVDTTQRDSDVLLISVWDWYRVKMENNYYWIYHSISYPKPLFCVHLSLTYHLILTANISLRIAFLPCHVIAHTSKYVSVIYISDISCHRISSSVRLWITSLTYHVISCLRICVIWVAHLMLWKQSLLPRFVFKCYCSCAFLFSSYLPYLRPTAVIVQSKRYLFWGSFPLLYPERATQIRCLVFKIWWSN